MLGRRAETICKVWLFAKDGYCIVERSMQAPEGEKKGKIKPVKGQEEDQ